MDRSISVTLDDIGRKLDRASISDAKKSRYASEIGYLKNKYESLDIHEGQREAAVYESLVKKGRELMKESNIRDLKKVDFYLRYCRAALYDLSGDLKPLNWIVRLFIATCILFLALSPQYFPFIMPLMFIIPIFLGLKGMKKRNTTGLYYGLSVMPMALLTSVISLNSFFLNLKDFNGYLAEQSQRYNMSLSGTKSLTILFTVLSVVMLLTAIYTIILAVKHRKMFI
jgi:hypothetical protein